VIKEALADPKHLIRKDRYEGTPLYWAETCIKGSNKQFGTFYVLPHIAPGRLEIGMTCPQTLQIL